jgi:hypothetical protein
MVVISASLLTKDGKILLARQFLEITRVQLDALLGSFIRQIDGERQHTYMENESARFIYLPLDNNIYLTLLTSKDSNIVDDIETLRTLQKIVQHYCPYGVSEGTILKASFDIVFAFDDVITMGYRESITLSQILSYAEMESEEERTYKEKMKVQMQEVKEISKRKQQEFDKQRALEAKNTEKIKSSSAPNLSVSINPPSTDMATSITRDEASIIKDLSEPSSVKVAKKGMDLRSKSKRTQDFM